MASSSPPPTMRAAVIHQAGGPSVLQLEERPIPTPQAGQVLIQIHAFGLNRSELFTRQGHSPSVRFPRILGIECTGTVADCPGHEFARGEVVATAMGGLGRAFDGSYAEYTVVPAGQAQRIRTPLPWPTLGAMPEMLQTAWGSLFRALALQAGERLLVRGGSTSVGLAAAALAKHAGAHVSATTRSPDRMQLLQANGADKVLIDDGAIAAQIAAGSSSSSVSASSWSSAAFDKVLELVGVTTLEDSLRCVRPGGTVCVTGIVGNKWVWDGFAPMEAIPSTVHLTSYSGGAEDFAATPLEDLARLVRDGTLKLQIGRTFGLEDIVEAHRTMEENEGGGKIVILI